MVNARNKGAAFERLIVNKLNTVLEEKGLEERVKRNLDQYQTKAWLTFILETLRLNVRDIRTMASRTFTRMNGGNKL